jgi:AcrR family transcriptional regulator
MEEKVAKLRNKQNQTARERIVSAMMELIKKKPMSTIEIQELTEKAGVSRMTFYRNYSSREDVFLSRIQDILNCYRQDDKDRDLQGRFYDKERICHGFSYFYQHRDFVKALICCGFSDIFLQNLTEFALDKWMKDADDLQERYQLVSFVGIMFNSYLSWVQQPQYLTLDKLTDLVFSICKGAYGEAVNT